MRIYRDPEPNRGLFATIATLLILAIGAIGSMDYAHDQRSREHYCEMVLIYKTSNGERGWPDFKNQWSKCYELE